MLAADRRGAILVIEDDVSLRSLLVELLMEAGYDVLAAANGAVGLRLAQEHRPNLILLDLLLPVTTGLDLLNALRTAEHTRYIPIVMISGGHPSIALAQAWLPTDLLRITFDVDVVLAHVERMMALRETEHMVQGGAGS